MIRWALVDVLMAARGVFKLYSFRDERIASERAEHTVQEVHAKAFLIWATISK